MRTPLFLLLIVAGVLSTRAQAASEPLFDGTTLSGWQGDATVWRVQDGAITGGSLQGNPRNEFLATAKSYRNFILRLEYRLVGTEGFVNGGVQIRSVRIATPPNEMCGYQADIGAGYSGSLYDESRRNKVMAQADKTLIATLEKPGAWNRYEVRCEGGRIRLMLNGTQTVDYVETDAAIPRDGLIALQIHGKCKAEISYRDLTIEALADDLPTRSPIIERFADAKVEVAARPASGWSDGRFTLGTDDTLVFIGQENLVRESRAGELEARLGIAGAAHKPRFRCMAWEADTVYEQWRDLNFGAWSDQLAAVGATVAIVQFGQVEAFDGPARIGEFTVAYHRLLDQLAARTSRVVLLSPMACERSALAQGPDLTARNADVAAYAAAVRTIATQRGLVFVDLLAGLAGRAGDAPRLTDDGFHLNAVGLRTVADVVVRGLGLTSAPVSAELLTAISAKNRLFFDCWRPANWSFAYGDRVSQLYGKPAGGFPSLAASFERHKPLIAAWDARIQALAAHQPAPAAPVPLPLPGADDALPTPEATQAALKIADGWSVTPFASERDGVAKPTQIAWDARGRLYVACSPTYPQTLPGVAPADYILACEDADHDGRAERSWKFAEGFTMVQGVVAGDGGLYVCDFDHLLFLKDTDGDGKADERRTLFSGFGIGDTHQLINSISYGPDGSLWFTQGLHAFSRVESAHGLTRLDKSGVWRLRPRTGRLDGFFNGAKAGHNCWGVAFDDWGQPFHKSGDRPEGYWSLPGLVRLADPDEYHPRGALFRSEAKTTALDFIGTAAQPDDLQGAAVIGGFFRNTLDLQTLSDDGAGFASKQLPKLITTADTSFRPVDVSIGPDGAIYVADWCVAVIGHYQASYADPKRDRTHGRIWRIARTDRPAVRQPALTTMTPQQLLKELRSPERWTRQQAARLLADGEPAAVLAAVDAWIATLSPEARDDHLRLEALGIVQALEAPRPALLAAMLASSDHRCRAYATRAIAGWAAQLDQPLTLLSARIRDDHPRVRVEAIVACSEIRSAAAVEVTLLALASPRDRFIDHALAQTVRALKPQWLPALAAGTLTCAGDATQLAYLRAAAGAVVAPAHPGKAIYDGLCLTCHQADGKGLSGIYPPLAGSDWIAGEARPLIRTLLHGLSGPLVINGQTYGVLPMPPMGLDDRQLADVLSFVRSSFSNNAAPVTPEQVAAERAASTARATPWTAADIGR